MEYPPPYGKLSENSKGINQGFCGDYRMAVENSLDERNKEQQSRSRMYGL